METRFIFVVVALLALSIDIQAQVPQLINYQGRLDQGTTPVTTPQTMRFAIYAVATGGVAVWAETKQNVQVNNGVFSVILGSDTTFPSTLFGSTGDRYLEVTVAGNVMVPRSRFTSVAYAVQAGTVPDNAITSAKIADLTITGADIANGQISQTKLSFTPGTVTSISQGSGISLSSNPITTSGSISVASLGITSSMLASGSVSASKLSLPMFLSGTSSPLFDVSSTGERGGEFSGARIGILGFSSNRPSGTNWYGGGYFDYNAGQAFAYVGAINSAGTPHKIVGVGAVSTIMNTRAGRQILYAPESPEPWFEDIGSAKLVNGFAHVELDPLFVDCITINEANPIRVFVQLTDQNTNGVYVKKTSTGFDVLEQNNGRSNTTFDYRVMGRWKGFEGKRFGDAPGPLSREERPSQNDESR